MDLRLDAQRVEVTTRNYKQIDVEVYDIDKDDVLNHFKIEDVLDHFGQEIILDYIGEKECKKYFHLTDKY